MVHCWEKLKEANKWKLSYASYKEAVRNGTAKDIVDGEEKAPGENAHVRRPRGQKATKADLAREASAMAMAEALKSILANSQEAMAIRDEKKRLEKEATAAMYINLTKEAIEARRLDAEAMRLDAEAKTRAEDNKIMLADVSSMDEDQRAWILKKRAEIRARDA